MMIVNQYIWCVQDLLSTISASQTEYTKVKNPFVEYDESDEKDVSILNFGNIEINVNIPDYDVWYKDYMKEQIVKCAVENIENEIKERKCDIDYLKEEYERTKTKLKILAEDLNLKKMLLIKNTEVDKIKDDVINEIDRIYSHKKVVKVEWKDGLYITVCDVIITEPYSGRKFYIGEAVISLPIANSECVYFYETPNTHRAIGFWKDYQIHPHVDNEGIPCMGNADAMIADYLNNKQYYAAFITALNYLQTCNVEDIAGYAVSKWDELLEDGTIIEGHPPVPGEYGDSIGHFSEYDENECCAICGEEIDYDDEIYHCYECGRPCCSDHVTFVDSVSEYVCDECLDEFYTRCSDCGELFRTDIMYFDEETSEWFCSDCWDERGSEEAA